MKTLVLLVSVFTLSTLAYATPQQEKMKACNAEAKTKALKGGERKAFMSTCLSGSAAAEAHAVAEEAKPTDSKERMKWCNGKAKGMKGAERKTFMSGCLKS